ncbi:MAG TPA: glutathione S-transferase [Solirubrobacteraceae bacterium]|nr:glutathione S-transferase [Solirubrobacteraceae bacterium]
MESSQRPILWHIAVSHFSEKARWALEYKGVAHVRRAPPPGVHIPLVLGMTRGAAYTLPLLELSGERIADSTAIIAALERRFPRPALYPRDERQRARALALEERLDERLAPYVRRLAFYELRRDPRLMAEVATRSAPALARRLGRALGPYARAFTALRYRAADAGRAREARERVLAELAWLESELAPRGGSGEREYLVGERFGVADLTAAALLYPLVLPAEGPSIVERMPEGYERFRASLAERRIYGWVREMYARHRLRRARVAPVA